MKSSPGIIYKVIEMESHERMAVEFEEKVIGEAVIRDLQYLSGIISRFWLSAVKVTRDSSCYP